MADCAGIILAAGEGSRFSAEQNKLLAKYKGKPLVSWSVAAALDAVKAGADIEDIYVVMGAADLSSVLPDSVTLINNESWQSGQGCSLQVGIECAKQDGYKQVVVGLGDAPLVPASAWLKVADSEGVIVTATYRGRRSPPVKLDEQVWTMLPLSGDEGAKSLMLKRPELVVEVACAGDPKDVDTPEDLI